MSFASSGESKSGGGGNVFLFIPPDCHHKKITQVGCGIKLTQSHNFAVKTLRVNSYDKITTARTTKIPMVISESIGMSYSLKCIMFDPFLPIYRQLKF